MDERDRLMLLVFGGLAVMFVLVIAQKSCELESQRSEMPTIPIGAPKRSFSFSIEPPHYGLQHCLDGARARPEKHGLLFRYYIDDPCDTKYENAAANLAFSDGARAAFKRLHAREVELRPGVRALSGDEPEADVVRLYAPRRAAARELDPFMPEIQRIAPSAWHPEAAPTGPVAPVR